MPPQPVRSHAAPAEHVGQCAVSFTMQGTMQRTMCTLYAL